MSEPRCPTFVRRSAYEPPSRVRARLDRAAGRSAAARRADRAGATRIYTDRASTRAERRPELDRLLERVDAGDTIVVWRLDRLARSLTELIALVAELGRRQVNLRSLTEQIDTGPPVAGCCST